MSARLVHVLAGVASFGRRTRATCWCSWSTTPRASTERALGAFRAEHASDPLVCGLCDRVRADLDHLGRPRLLRLLQAGPGDQILVCSDNERTCADLTGQRQVHLGRTAFEAFGVKLPRPTLRVVR